jgi:hypothetical protein
MALYSFSSPPLSYLRTGSDSAYVSKSWNSGAVLDSLVLLNCARIFSSAVGSVGDGGDGDDGETETLRWCWCRFWWTRLLLMELPAVMENGDANDDDEK